MDTTPSLYRVWQQFSCMHGSGFAILVFLHNPSLVNNRVMSPAEIFKWFNKYLQSVQSGE